MPWPTFAKQDEIPEAFRGEYEEREGAWHPKADGVAAQLAEAQAKLADEAKLRDAAEKLTRKASAELQRLQTLKKAEGAGLKGEELEQLRADVRAEVEADLAPRLAKAEKAEALNHKLIVETGVKRFAAEAKVLPERQDRFYALYGGEFEPTEDGKLVVKGKPGMDPAKHVAALAKELPEWLAGTKSSGGGALGGAGRLGAGKMTAEEILKDPYAGLQAANAESMGH